MPHYLITRLRIKRVEHYHIKTRDDWSGIVHVNLERHANIIRFYTVQRGRAGEIIRHWDYQKFRYFHRLLCVFYIMQEIWSFYATHRWALSNGKRDRANGKRVKGKVVRDLLISNPSESGQSHGYIRDGGERAFRGGNQTPLPRWGPTHLPFRTLRTPDA